MWHHFTSFCKRPSASDGSFTHGCQLNFCKYACSKKLKKVAASTKHEVTRNFFSTPYLQIKLTNIKVHRVKHDKVKTTYCELKRSQPMKGILHIRPQKIYAFSTSRKHRWVVFVSFLANSGFIHHCRRGASQGQFNCISDLCQGNGKSFLWVLHHSHLQTASYYNILRASSFSIWTLTRIFPLRHFPCSSSIFQAAQSN